MPVKYPLRDEPDKTMFVFEKNGKVYGHIIKNRTDKSPAKFIFETEKYNSIAELKAEYSESHCFGCAYAAGIHPYCNGSGLTMADRNRGILKGSEYRYWSG